MKSGVQGGLIIGRFDPAYTVELGQTHSTSTKIAMMHLWETQSVLEIFAAERLAAPARLGRRRLRTAVDRLGPCLPGVSWPYRRSCIGRSPIAPAIAALSLFVHILLHHDFGLAPIDALRIPWLIKMHRRLVDAICAYDRRSPVARWRPYSSSRGSGSAK
jgi:hypothetical protein